MPFKKFFNFLFNNENSEIAHVYMKRFKIQNILEGYFNIGLLNVNMKT